MSAIYLDHHSTTPVDPRVVEAMVPYFLEHFGNAGSISHAFGWQAKEAVERAREQLASAIGASSSEIIFTSGATESNNLALRGVVLRKPTPAAHVISLVTEHRALLDPLRRLERQGIEVTRLPVHDQNSSRCSQPDLDQLADAIRPETQLVSVMLANNEIGTIIDLRPIHEICQARGVLLHSDATQAVGKIPVQVSELGVDLMSFSAHKLYGPKGIGALYVRQRSPSLRLVPQIEGGGQERGLRSGTLPVPLIVGFAAAVGYCLEELPGEGQRLAHLRQRLLDRLKHAIPDLRLNGPAFSPLEDPYTSRLAHNLNVQFPGVDGETLMMNTPQVAVSSGSACSAASPEPSHVLKSLGLTDDEVRSSLRFGLGRWTTEAQVDQAADSLAASMQRLRALA